MEEEKLYSVNEYSKITRLSTVSIYKRINKNYKNFNDYVVIKDGKRFIRAQALDQEEEKARVEDSWTSSASGASNQEVKEKEPTSSEKDEIIRILKENIEDLKRDKEFLQEQLEGKNKQIETLTGSLQGMQLLLVANTRGTDNQEQEPQVIYTAQHEEKEEVKEVETRIIQQEEKKKSVLTRLANWLKNK